MEWREIQRAEHVCPAGAYTDETPLQDQGHTPCRLLWSQSRRYGPGMQVERGGGDRRRIIASGWACDLRILCDGRRQIFAFLLPGDTIDLARPQSLGACAVVA